MVLCCNLENLSYIFWVFWDGVLYNIYSSIQICPSTFLSKRINGHQGQDGVLPVLPQRPVLEVVALELGALLEQGPVDVCPRQARNPEKRTSLSLCCQVWPDWASVYFGQFFGNCRISPNFLTTLFTEKVMWYFWQKKAWATFWAILLSTRHLCWVCN
jgi:hypothetical protein